MILQHVATEVTDRKPARNWPRTVAEVLNDHVALELESLDRVYLNVYQPELQTLRAVFQFLRDHHGQGAVSSHLRKRAPKDSSRASTASPTTTTSRSSASRSV